MNNRNIYQVFTVEELSCPYNLSPVVLPTKNDVLRFVLSRTRFGNESHESVVSSLAREVSKVWNDADCCPVSVRSIHGIFKREVWDVYQYLIKEKHLPGIATMTMKRSHKKDPSKSKPTLQPCRKSLRRSTDEASVMASLSCTSSSRPS